VEILRFAILRPGLGGAYALLAQGILMMYRGSGTVNFAQRAAMRASRLLPFRLGARRCPMGSLIEELQRREAESR
jgi:hypothetical protein